jgi:hypothetical protein
MKKYAEFTKKYAGNGKRSQKNSTGMETFSKTAIYMLIAVCMTIGYSSCSEDDDDKPAGSTYFSHDGHSYLIVKELKTWVDAASDAKSRGGYLVEIDNQAEQDAVYLAITKSGVATNYVAIPDGGGAAYLWLGGSDRYGEGSWLWNGANQSGTFPLFWLGDETGSAVGGAFVNWGGKSTGTCNEPDNFTDSSVSPKGQSAAAIAISNWPYGKAGEWNDIAETNKLYYVVEFDEIK